MKNIRSSSKYGNIGFLLVLFLCVASIAVVAYITFFTGNPVPNTPENLQNPDELENIIPNPPQENQNIIPNQQQNETEPVVEEKQQEEPEPAEPVVAQPKTVSYKYPLVGDTTKAYVVDSVVYSSTFGDWRIHKGMDIMSEENGTVKAAADGTVEDVYFDELMGQTVVIKHEDGLRTVYANMETNVTVKKNDEVRQGDVIGAVGQSSPAECMDVPHLHFEMIENGEQIDPEEKLK